MENTNREKDNMLEYSLFRRLPHWSQVEELNRNGVLLAHRYLPDWKVSLYSFDNYFVEVWSGKGVKIPATFRKTANAVAILEPYLDNLEVKNFLELD
jgi:hypothetical protein